MPANNVNTAVIPSMVSSIRNLIVNTADFQHGANTVYYAKSTIVGQSGTGKLPSANGNPTFKSDYERMQFLIGKIGAGGSFGTPPKTFS